MARLDFAITDPTMTTEVASGMGRIPLVECHRITPRLLSAVNVPRRYARSGSALSPVQSSNRIGSGSSSRGQERCGEGDRHHDRGAGRNCPRTRGADAVEDARHQPRRGKRRDRTKRGAVFSGSRLQVIETQSTE
jgi:hypothetical protein